MSAYDEIYQEGWDDCYGPEKAPYDPFKDPGCYEAYARGRMAHWYRDHPLLSQREIVNGEDFKLTG